jgi:hypothetical protein
VSFTVSLNIISLYVRIQANVHHPLGSQIAVSHRPVCSIRQVVETRIQ